MALTHRWHGISCAGLLVATWVLASCGGSGSGGVAYVPLAPAEPGVPAPCAAAFAAPGTGLGVANTSPHDSETPGVAAPSLSARLRALGIDTANRLIRPAQAQNAVPLTPLVVRLSSCKPDAAGNITIGGPNGCGPNVVIDRDFTERTGNPLGKITIEKGAGLAVPHALDGTLELETTGIRVAGTLSLGTATCPVGSASHPNGRVKVTFTGQADSSGGHAGHSSGSGSDKGIEVIAGGTLRLYGAKGVAKDGVNWTHLSQPAGPAAYQHVDQGIGAPVAVGGDSRLYLANDVVAGGWRPGDWIVVATSSFSPFESEFVQIDAVTATAGDTSIVTLRQPLRHYHFGGRNPGLPGEANYGAGAELNFGVDERAEVGLISRSVTLTARTPAAPEATRSPGTADPYLHWGGEIRILDGFTEVGIQGVELEKFGKPRLGSYPVHFHLANNAAGKHLVDSNSIHHSYNKCVTVHQTQGVNITNNVCARAVGHLFYQEIAEEQGGAFLGNLGIGAQSHYFGLADNVPRTADGRVRNYWEGDHLGRASGYDSLEVPNMDAQDNPMRGACYRLPGPDGMLLVNAPPGAQGCAADHPLYVEPASGFWIGNPGTVMEGNSIAGCQGTGKGYWYVPPRAGSVGHEPVGRFRNNRVHACYDGLFAEEHNTDTGQLFPRVGGAVTGKSLIGRFEGLTATRIRNRGVWVRPVWYAVEKGRFATNRDSVTLVTSGGVDGNAPAAWALLQDSVLVGLSTNNVDRWGPCSDLPSHAQAPEGLGCMDFGRTNARAMEHMDKGYQTPFWNSAGYMIYDGPVRIIRNHFANFRVDISPLLTVADQAYLKAFRAYPNAQSVYEGDAALGWFQSNQSGYPTATVTRGLSFDNVDLRHQIYTEHVNLAPFRDGDKNTAVIDLDGTLTGYRIVDAKGVPVPDEFPVSLNNLPFNRNGNAVDECLATGAQDAAQEGRPTSLISPANMATLEFEALRAPQSGSIHWQDMLFSKDSLDEGRHQSMRLQSRNGLGVWEPKVASGASYSVQALDTTMPGVDPASFRGGMPRQVQVGLTDAVKSHMDKSPFHVRVGICYSGAGGAPPANDFTVVRGYKSWGGNGVNIPDPDLRPYFNFYDGQEGRPSCFNLDSQNPGNLLAGHCPARGQIPVPAAGCPAGSVSQGGQCLFNTQAYQPVQSIAELTRPDGTPAATDKYFYDSRSGMLYFYVTQTAPNARGAAPLGSCLNTTDPACPGAGELETYYPCPPEGCTSVMVTVNDPAYVPGAAKCDSLSPGGSIYGAGGLGTLDLPGGATGYTVPPPVITHRLAYADGGGEIVVPNARLSSGAKGRFLHWVPSGRAPTCETTTPKQPALARQARADAPRLTGLAGLRAQMPSMGNAMRIAARDAAPPPAAAVDLLALAQSQICTGSAGASLADANRTALLQ